jgi:hypothetical protein
MTYSDFIVLYPEFNSVTKYPQSKVEAIISDSVTEINEDKWGVYYSRGLGALSGHLLAMWYMNTLGDGSSRADIMLSKNPDISVEFQGRRNGQVKPSSFERTEYGVEYLRLQQIVAYMQPRQSISYV